MVKVTVALSRRSILGEHGLILCATVASMYISIPLQSWLMVQTFLPLSGSLRILILQRIWSLNPLIPGAIRVQIIKYTASYYLDPCGSHFEGWHTMHAHTWVYTHTFTTWTYTHMHRHTHIHTHAQAHTHTHTCTGTHTYTLCAHRHTHSTTKKLTLLLDSTAEGKRHICPININYHHPRFYTQIFWTSVENCVMNRGRKASTGDFSFNFRRRPSSWCPEIVFYNLWRCNTLWWLKSNTGWLLTNSS